MTTTVLTSDWTGLSDILIARFYPVERNGGQAGGYEVHAPLTQVEMDVDLNWQSPFEASGVDNKAPALTAMVQSGAIQSVMSALRDNVAPGDSNNNGFFAQTDSQIRSLANDFQGPTGITKLNSTQIFSGMAPIRITLSAKFRAFSDSKTEVELPYRKLLEWALPEELAPDGIVANLLRSNPSDVTEVLKALLPSKAPQLIGFQYKNRTFAPMVIESISEPMDSPVDETGDYTELLVPMTISTLTALDRRDLQQVMQYQGTHAGNWWNYY